LRQCKFGSSFWYMVGGGIENKHSTDVESTYRVILSVLAFTLKVSRGAISVEYLFSTTTLPEGAH